jgi:predicted CXXCH cytochrome family protein
VRRLALLSGLGALLACAHREPTLAPRAKVEFVMLPESEAARARNPHAFGGSNLCQRCHVPGEERPSTDPIDLCVQCHDPKPMKHPYRVAQAKGAEGLPLMPGRLIACHTCHDPHDVKKRRSGLREEYLALCLKCHEGHR